MEKPWVMAPMEKTLMEKALWTQWNMFSWFIAPMDKAWFYGRLFFKEIIVMVKDKKTTA